ncbi:hypothetical protein REPUB_Repub05bG0022400 [Reevesia pubescens]
MAKRAKLSKEVDRISLLPDKVLCHIISFLPLKEAICTSILSKRWSKIFTLMSNLSFEDYFKKRKLDSYRFMNFVDQVLFYHIRDVDKFRLKCGEFIDPNRVDGWIRYALRNNVRELDLCLNCKEFKMPIWVFTCKTLVSLRLNILGKCKFVLKLPLKISFPSLKSLHLFGIQFPDDDSIRRLFSSCSMLEELVVDVCILKEQCKFNVSSPTLKRLTIAYTGGGYKAYEILIDAPSLVYFKWHCSLPKRFLLKNLNSLVKACIHCGTFFDCYEYFVTHNTAATDLFNGIRNIQSFHLSGVFDELFLAQSSIIPEFPKLTYLNLEGDIFIGWEKVLTHLLACFPCLEALVLKVNLHKFLRDISITTLSSYRFPSLLWSQLKTVKILSFEGKKDELQMVEYFLKNAEVLENFMVQTIARRKQNPAKWRSKITKTLLNLPKVSEKCKVLVA